MNLALTSWIVSTLAGVPLFGLLAVILAAGGTVAAVYEYKHPHTRVA